MNKNLHDTDDFFKAAYEEFEEEPSAEAWEKINVGLDKKEDKPDRKKILFRRRTAIILLLVLIGIVLSDSIIVRPSNKNIIPLTSKSHSSKTLVNQADINNQKKISSGKKNNITPKSSLFVQQPIVSALPFNAGIHPVVIANDYNHGLITESTPTSLTTASSEKLNTPGIFKVFSNNKLLVTTPVVNDSLIKNGEKKNRGEKKEESFTPFWMITPLVSYERAGYRLDSDLPINITSIKHREVHEPSFSAGILTTRQFTKHWGLQTGLIYSNTAIGISPQKIYAFQNAPGDISYKYITSSGYAYIKPGFGAPPAFGDSLTSSEAKHTIEKITVPLIAKYRMGNKRISLVPGAGIEANFITKANLEVEIEDAFNREIVVVNKLNGTKSFYFSALVDAELQYKLNKKISINLRPAYRFALSPMTENNVVETFPHSLGIGAGLTIRF